MFALPCNLYMLPSHSSAVCESCFFVRIRISEQQKFVATYVCAAVADLPVAGVAADVAFRGLCNLTRRAYETPKCAQSRRSADFPGKSCDICSTGC